MDAFTEPATLITALLSILCLLASLDLWRQYALRTENVMIDKYSRATKSGFNFWQFGYRLEDLELRLYQETSRIDEILNILRHPSHQLRQSKESSLGKEKLITEARVLRNQLQNSENNKSAIFQLRCEKNGNILRLGLNEFRTDPRDVCQVFTSLSNENHLEPLSLFEMVPLFDGAFGLRSIANGFFLKAIGPPQESKSLPWKLVAAGPVAGFPERFRLSNKSQLYSPIIDGFLTCQKGEIVKGYSGITSSSNRFTFEKVSNDDVEQAFKLVSLSKEIMSIQKGNSKQPSILIESNKTNRDKNSINYSAGGESDKHTPVKICIAVPVTSKGTRMSSVLESPFWTNIFDTFMKSIDWRSNHYYFKFYIGFDKADSIYDTGDAWTEFRDEFNRRAGYRMSEQLIENDETEFLTRKYLALKLMHFEHLDGAPSQVVSQLVLAAYMDSYEYFYQVNDDTIVVSPNWPSKLISCLSSNPFISNFGVTGPTDTNNEKIFTHSFIHRTHIDIFGYLFPPSFKNWWSDDWITTVYGSDHTYICPDVTIKHNVGVQKLSKQTRYEVDQGAQLRLTEELRKGYVKIDEWLKKNSFPRLTLPNICGYSPLVANLLDRIKSK